MAKTGKFITAFLLLAVFSQAILIPKKIVSRPLCAVVTQIDITCTFDGYTLSRCYRTQEKLETVLTYLRLLKPRKLQGADPEQVAGERYRMVLTFSDGRKKAYLQHSYRYLSADYAPWQVIDPTTAARLHALMEATPGDEKPPADESAGGNF